MTAARSDSRRPLRPRQHCAGVWARADRPGAVGRRAAARGRRRAARDEPRLAGHRAARLGPVQRGRAFAAALQCERDGCGECTDCRTSLSGAHPDVTLVRTEQLSIGVDEVRELVRRAAMSPTLGRRQVHRGRGRRPGHRARRRRPAEEHRGAGAATVWILCAPTPDDVVADHPLALPAAHPADPERRPPWPELLQTRDGIEPELAAYAARVAQGHVGRARALARDESGAGPAARGAADPVPADRPRLPACRPRPSWSRPPPRRPPPATAELDAQETAAPGGGAGLRHQGCPAPAGPGRDEGPGGPAEGAGQAVPARRHRPGADRADRLLPRRCSASRPAPAPNWSIAELAPQIGVLARKTTAGVHAAPDRRAARLPRGPGRQRGPAAGGRVHPDRPGQRLIRCSPPKRAAKADRNTCPIPWIEFASRASSSTVLLRLPEGTNPRAFSPATAKNSPEDRINPVVPPSLWAAFCVPEPGAVLGLTGKSFQRCSAKCHGWTPVPPAPGRPGRPRIAGPSPCRSPAADLDRDTTNRRRRAEAKLVAKKLIKKHELPMKVIGIDFVDGDPEIDLLIVDLLHRPAPGRFPRSGRRPGPDPAGSDRPAPDRLARRGADLRRARQLRPGSVLRHLPERLRAGQPADGQDAGPAARTR